MRLIDADALIEDCEKYLKTLNPDRGGKEYTKATWIIDVLKNVPTIEERKWIPWDSGRLPDDSGTYIVTAYDGVQERVTFANYQKRLKRWELTGARAYWRVLAWMSLPEPWRGEEE